MDGHEGSDTTGVPFLVFHGLMIIVDLNAESWCCLLLQKYLKFFITIASLVSVIKRGSI